MGGAVAAELFLLVTIVGVSLAAAGWLAHRLNLPSALGYLAVGMAFAPSVGLTPDLPTGMLDTASHIGVLFVLFFIGLELDIRTLRRVLGDTAIVSIFDILVPAALILVIGQFLGWSFTQALVLGFAVSLSSTIFGDRMSASKGFPRAGRQRNFGILIAEDVAAGAILALLAVLSGSSGGWGFILPLGRLLFFLVLAAAAALLVVPRMVDALHRTRAPELMGLGGLVLVIAFGLVGGLIGSAELGAFLAGVAAAEAGSRFVLRNTLTTLRDLGLAVFFLTAGLHVDAGAIASNLLPILAIALAFLLTKLLVHVPASLTAGMDLTDAIRTALGLSAIGEFSLIVAATAATTGLAHPLLGTYIVGVMLILLFLAPLLLNVAPHLVGVLNRLPRQVTNPARAILRGIPHRRPGAQPARTGRSPGRVLLANLILIVAWVLFSVWASPRLQGLLPLPAEFAGAAAIGLLIALGTPLLLFSYRAYRDVVRGLVGLDEEGDGASRVRARLVDAWVALTGFMVLLPITLLLPSTLPVLAGGALVAIIILVVAWRGLVRFHRAVAGSITRVLGHDPKTAAFLDKVLEKYPWGVRFAAGTVAPESPVVGLTITESRLAELSGALVAVLERKGVETVNPPLATRLMAGDGLVLIGTPEELAKAEALLVAHGNALRASVQSRLADVVELPVSPGSPFVGRTLGEADLRGRTGALVVGVWPHGAAHPEPFRPDLVVQADDHLIVLGSELQVDRARRLTSGDT